jgi:hypothetical protein
LKPAGYAGAFVLDKVRLAQRLFDPSPEDGPAGDLKFGMLVIADHALIPIEVCRRAGRIVAMVRGQTRAGCECTLPIGRMGYNC